jgi:hypothetical protein
MLGHLDVVGRIILKYCDGFVQRIARQRLGKHARNTRGQQRKNISVFYVVRATQQYKTCVSAWSVPRLYSGCLFMALISRVKNHGD